MAPPRGRRWIRGIGQPPAGAPCQGMFFLGINRLLFTTWGPSRQTPSPDGEGTTPVESRAPGGLDRGRGESERIRISDVSERGLMTDEFLQGSVDRAWSGRNNRPCRLHPYTRL